MRINLSCRKTVFSILTLSLIVSSFYGRAQQTPPLETIRLQSKNALITYYRC